MKRNTLSLATVILTTGGGDRLAAECARLAESRMARRGGLSGMAVKAGLALLKKARPDILERATARMLPDMLAALEPLHIDYAADPAARRGGFDAYLTARSVDATVALLKVSDARAAASVNITAKSLYARLRGSGEQEVRDAMPELAAILARYVD